MHTHCKLKGTITTTVKLQYYISRDQICIHTVNENMLSDFWSMFWLILRGTITYDRLIDRWKIANHTWQVDWYTWRTQSCIYCDRKSLDMKKIEWWKICCEHSIAAQQNRGAVTKNCTNKENNLLLSASTYNKHIKLAHITQYNEYYRILWDGNMARKRTRHPT